MNGPRVTKRDRKLHLSYETSSRIHCSVVYPHPAPNGSEVLLYGHSNGIRILWRGGKRRKEPVQQRSAPPAANARAADVIVIDDSDDEPPKSQATVRQVEEEYEDVEADDGDEDCPYPDFVQDLDIESTAHVSHIAIPSITSAAASQLPDYARSHMVFAAAYLDHTIRVICVPLKPPSNAEKLQGAFSIEARLLPGHQGLARGLAVKLPYGSDRDEKAQNHVQLMIAACGSDLSTWHATIRNGRIKIDPRVCIQPQTKINSVAFPASRTQMQLLTSDREGNVRIYNFSDHDVRPTSSDSTTAQQPNPLSSGRWGMAYHAPFFSSKSSPAMVRQKTILAASWVLGGRGIIVLLEDGEWGIWTDQGGQPGRNILNFALNGFVGQSTSDAPESGAQLKAGVKLAPMTPNTRKSRSEKLFKEPQRTAGAASSGGIAVTPISSRSGAADERVFIWYDNDIFSIPSMQTFWQRSNSSATGGTGSLYAPGLTHITDLNLMNENITRISQFATNPSTTAFGQMNRQPNLLVSAEHRFIILQNLQSSNAKGGLFQQALEQPTLQDQRMLDAGELDLGGMDRMLSSMAAGGGAARSRRVGFAH